MSLEQRVQKLEDEVKILKNQIQNTLLEIQAEIMNHYYTSLRAEDSSRDDRDIGNHRDNSSYGDEPANEALRTSSQETQMREAAINNTSRASAPVSARENYPEAPPKKTVPESEKEEAASSVDWASFAKLTRWVSETAEEIGAANTRKVIETCQAQGYGNGHMLESLVGFLASEDDGEDASRDPVSTDRILAALAELSQLLARDS